MVDASRPGPQSGAEAPAPRGEAVPRSPLYAAGFVTAFGAHAVAANLGHFALGHHTSLVELSVLLAVYDGAEIVLKPVFGALADRIGPKPVLVGGLVAFGLASLGFVLANNPGLLGLARLAQGSAAAAFSPAAGALVALSGGAKARGRSFSGYGAAKSLGYLSGPVVGGALVLAGGYGLLFGLLAGMAAVAALAAWRVVPSLRPPLRSRETLLGLARRLTARSFIAPVGVLAATTAATSTAVGFFPVQGARAHLDPVATGAIVSLVAGAAIVAQLRAGRALDQGRLHAQAAAWALAVAAAGIALAGLPRVLPLTVGSLLVGVGVGVATPLAFASLADAAPAGRMGQTMGAAEVGRELGDAGGPLLVGALAPLGLGIALAGLAAGVAVPGALYAGSRTARGLS